MVGSVERIKFVKKGTRDGKPDVDSILVTISLPSDYILCTNASVSTETSLTGAANVNISDLGYGTVLPADQWLKGQTGGLTALMASVNGMTPKIEMAIDNYNNDLYPKLSGDLSKIGDIVTAYKDDGARITDDIHTFKTDLQDRFNTIADDAHTWLGSGSGDFHGSMADIHAITAHIKEKLPGLTTTAQQLIVHADSDAAKLEDMMPELKSTVGDVKASTGSLKSIMERDHGRIDESIDGLHRTMENFDTFSREISVNPSSLFFGVDDSEKTYNAARQFAQGARDLSNAATELRAALAVPQPDPLKVRELYDNLNAQFVKFHQVEDALWKQVK